MTEPNQLRHLGTVRIRDTSGALAIVLADGRQCVAPVREVKSSLFSFAPGSRVVCSVMKREGVKALLAFDIVAA